MSRLPTKKFSYDGYSNCLGSVVPDRALLFPQCRILMWLQHPWKDAETEDEPHGLGCRVSRLTLLGQSIRRWYPSSHKVGDEVLGAHQRARNQRRRRILPCVSELKFLCSWS